MFLWIALFITQFYAHARYEHVQWALLTHLAWLTRSDCLMLKARRRKSRGPKCLQLEILTKYFPIPDIGKYFSGETPDIMIVGHTWQPPLQPDLRRLIVKEFPTRMHFTWDCEYCEKKHFKEVFLRSFLSWDTKYFAANPATWFLWLWEKERDKDCDSKLNWSATSNKNESPYSEKCGNMITLASQYQKVHIW